MVNSQPMVADGKVSLLSFLPLLGVMGDVACGIHAQAMALGRSYPFWCTGFVNGELP